MTLVVNLFGGPGVSKSTTTALAFGKLKIKGVNAEIAAEFAKDLTWEGRDRAISFQPYVAAKQIWRVHRLLGQVDVVLTDSPILLSSVYRGVGYTPAFEAFLLETFNSWDTLNVHLIRDTEHHAYNPKGRRQSLSEAEAVDADIDAMLEHFRIDHYDVPVLSGEATADCVVDLICDLLGPNFQSVTPLGRKVWVTS